MLTYLFVNDAVYWNHSLILQAMSPDGEAIVTGAGDETLRFWNVFSKTRSTKVWFFFFLVKYCQYWLILKFMSSV